MTESRKRIFSAEHRRKLSEASKGRPKSAEANKKMGMTKLGNKYRLGKKQSDEAKKKNRESHLGKKTSPETKMKISAALKGRKPPMAGRKHTAETKEKIRASYRGWNNGEKAYWWKGGITPIKKQVRESFKYRQWRSDIFTRDGFSCVLCGTHGGYLEADHYPVMFSEIFNNNNIENIEQALICEEFWNLNNGRTLCKSCHDSTKHGRPYKEREAKR